MTNAVARASVTIAAPKHRVWEALTEPSWIVRYMPVSDFVADWREGGSIAWKGQLGRKVCQDWIGEDSRNLAGSRGRRQ